MPCAGRLEPGLEAAALAERRRISRIYERYQQAGQFDERWGDGPASRFIQEVKWDALAGWIAGAATSSRTWVVDLGSGPRSELAEPQLGAGMMPARVIALDIRESCARSLARQSSVRPLLGHAAHLPIATGSVGIVYQSLMLSSVLDAALRRRIYAEIARVLAPGGWFLSYDTRYPNPWNPNTRPVVLSELRDAFAGWRQRHRTLTGLPPLIRVLAPLSRTLCRAMEAIPPLRSHRLFLAEKRGHA